MKKKAILLLASLLLLFSGFTNVETTESTTPVRLCFWPKVGIPWWVDTVNGLNIGLINYGNVYGVDLGIVSLSKDVKGGKVALITNGEEAGGLNLGIINLLRKMSGFQIGIYNRAIEYGSGGQIGFVNRAGVSDALQLGIINIMENGFVRIFPIFNLPDKWFH